jgi:hypothetical protein
MGAVVRRPGNANWWTSVLNENGSVSFVLSALVAVWGLCSIR